MSRPLIIVSAIIENNAGQILMGPRKDKENNAYCFPGGKVERRESLVEACSREVLEETSLTVLQRNWIFLGYTEPKDKLVMFLYTRDYFGTLYNNDHNTKEWVWKDAVTWPISLVEGMELFRANEALKQTYYIHRNHYHVECA